MRLRPTWGIPACFPQRARPNWERSFIDCQPTKPPRNFRLGTLRGKLQSGKPPTSNQHFDDPTPTARANHPRATFEVSHITNFYHVIQRSTARSRRWWLRPRWRCVYENATDQLVFKTPRLTPLSFLQAAVDSNNAILAHPLRSPRLASSSTLAKARWFARASTSRSPNSTPSCTSRTRLLSAR